MARRSGTDPDHALPGSRAVGDPCRRARGIRRGGHPADRGSQRAGGGRRRADADELPGRRARHDRRRLSGRWRSPAQPGDPDRRHGRQRRAGIGPRVGRPARRRHVDPRGRHRAGGRNLRKPDRSSCGPGSGRPATWASSASRSVSTFRGVGANLADHPAVELDSGWRGSATGGPILHSIATFRSSAAPGDGAQDLMFWITDPEGDGARFLVRPGPPQAPVTRLGPAPIRRSVGPATHQAAGAQRGATTSTGWSRPTGSASSSPVDPRSDDWPRNPRRPSRRRRRRGADSSSRMPIRSPTSWGRARWDRQPRTAPSSTRAAGSTASTGCS